MKKKLALLMVFVLAASVLLASCGSKSMNGEASTDRWNGQMNDSSTGGGDAAPGAPSESWTEGGEAWNDAVEGVGSAIKPQTSLAEKIIYSADVSIETVEFDKAVESVEQMLQKYGAFLESSSVSGKSYSEKYYGYQTYRRANFVIRVPVSAFENMTRDMENVGNVTNRNVYTENITTRYYDTQSRVDSYRIEQERLLAMLEKCETVTDMIEIENRLSEVRYELESLESTLRNWQNQVDYSTVNVTLSEVQEYTKQVEIHRTYWQQIGDGLKNTLEDIGDFFKDLFKGFVVNLPTYILLAVFIGLAAWIVLAVIRKRKAKKAAGRGAVDLELKEEDKK